MTKLFNKAAALLAPCLDNVNTVQMWWTGLVSSRSGGRVHPELDRQRLATTLLRVIAEVSGLIYFKVSADHNTPGEPEAILAALNTSLLLVKKVIL